MAEPTCLLALPGATVRVSGPLPDGVAEAVTDLRATGGDVALDLRAGPVPAGWALDGPGPSGVRSPALVTDLLVTKLNRLVLDLDPDRLHLHAGTVAIGGRGVVLGGRSGSGKSTLALELCLGGATYLGDEVATLTPGSRTVVAYPKPLTLKGRAVDRVPRGARRWPGLDDRVHVVASDLAEVGATTTAEWLVLPRYAPESRPQVLRLSTAQAAIALLADALDAVRLGGAALGVVARWLARVDAYEVRYRDVGWAAEVVRSLPPAGARIVRAFALGSARRGDVRRVDVVATETSGAALATPQRGLAELHPGEVRALAGRAPAPGSLDRLRGLGLDLPPRPRPVGRWARASGLVPGSPVGVGAPDALRLADERLGLGEAPGPLVRDAVERLAPRLPRDGWALDGEVALLVDGPVPPDRWWIAGIDLVVAAGSRAALVDALRAQGGRPRLDGGWALPQLPVPLHLRPGDPTAALPVRVGDLVVPVVAPVDRPVGVLVARHRRARGDRRAALRTLAVARAWCDGTDPAERAPRLAVQVGIGPRTLRRPPRGPSPRPPEVPR